MILVVSSGSPAKLLLVPVRLLLEFTREGSALLDPIASVTLESLDDRVKDDDVSKELLDEPSVPPDSLEIGAGVVPAELVSSTGAELLLSSPQATRPITTGSSIAGNANRFISTS